MGTRRYRKTIAAMREHAATARPIYPTTTPLVRGVGRGADAGNTRKDASR